MTTQGVSYARPGLASTLLMLCAVAACSRGISTPVASTEIQSMEADNVVFGMVSFLTTSGVREGRIEADTAYIFADSLKADLRQMSIVFYDEDGRQRATVSGTSGEWSQDTDRMVAYGDVVLFVHADSSTIVSQEIHYDPTQERVWSDSTTVRTMKDGSVTSGSAFESDMSFENIRIQDMRGGARRISQ